MEQLQLKPGDVIRGPYWQEPVIVKLVESWGDYIHLVGATETNGHHVDQLIPLSEFTRIESVREQRLFSQEGWKVFLALEALRYRYASLFDPLLAMHVSKVDPLPHQIEAVYQYVLPYPRIRFLLADDPGAGKTIMAGLIIKELKLRRLIRRILIVVPGHLKDQWRRELKERFAESFEVVDRSRFESVYRENVWERENQLITSLDFAKQKDVLQSLSAVRFDLVIVDEAHKMAAYRYGEKVAKSERYKLGEVLSEIAHHLLFLTATPHKGDSENFRLFLDLLQPGIFSTEELLKEALEKRENTLFLRRVKEDLRDFEGKPLFLPRQVKTITFDLGKDSPEEKDLYNDLSRYVANQYNLALRKEGKRNVAFALVILQRRFASSTYALLKSLERRKQRLEQLLSQPIQEKVVAGQLFEIEDLEEIEDLSEEDRWKTESLWETVSVAESIEELRQEISVLERLMQKASTLIAQEKELKLQKLKESLQELSAHVLEPSQRKILIFTESRDTLEYLAKKLKEWHYAVNTIHGGMPLEERVKAEGVFRNQTMVMVATEAAGEGINLQFCNLMINYDIPWNPNRLEQRMGRIHRYGQTREVFIHNLVATDTREGKVLNKLFEKIEEIRVALGKDKVFDVVGELIEAKLFTQAMLEASVSARSIDEILQSLDQTLRVDQDYLNRVQAHLGEALATRYIDYTRLQQLARKAKEERLIPEYTQSFFLKAFERMGGRVRKLEGGIVALEAVPRELRRIGEEEGFKKLYGTIHSSYPRVAFDKEVVKRHPTVEFLSFGHPLFEALLQWVEKTLQDAIRGGATFYDPEGKLQGYLLFFEGEVKDGTGEVAGKRLFSILVTEGEVRPVPPAILWDLVEENTPTPASLPELEECTQRALKYAIQELERYRGELLEERQRQAGIKQKYGVKSLEVLIHRLDGDLIDLEGRRLQGEQVDLAIRNKQERKREYEQELRELQQLILQETHLSLSMPKYRGMIALQPLQQEGLPLESDAEVEAVGMRVALEYEQTQGRIPEDVSAQNLGFDIRSKDPHTDTLRYIEVKARAHRGPVALTPNEWFKAQRFGNEYYLYVVFHAASRPELHIIPNPAETLNAEEKVEIVRYLVQDTEVFSKGIKA